MTDTSNGHKVLIVKGSGGGGIGDRIKSALLGISYAEKENRAVFIDWCDARLIDETRNAFDEIFQLQNIAHLHNSKSVYQSLSGSVYPPDWNNKTDLSLHDVYTQIDKHGWNRALCREKFSFDLLSQRNEDILLMWEFDQAVEYAKYSGKESAHALLSSATRCMTFNNEVQAAAANVVNQKNEEKLIGVHIRKTNEFDAQKQSVSMQEYLYTVQAILKNQPGAKIFLATDNVIVAETLKDKFKDKLITRQKWFAEAGEKLHLNDACPDKTQALKDAATEMAALSHCDYLIYQFNSSFGECARLFFQGQQENVFALTPQAGKKQRIRQWMRKVTGR